MTPRNEPTISRRDWFKWETEAPHELTNTIVLTSAENRFVDTRILKDSAEDNHFEGIRSFTQLDWAFAGTSSSKPKTGLDNQPQTHSIWTHFVDSRTPNPETVSDEGDMVPTLGGKTVERGMMLNPATGALTPYEECWAGIPATPTTAEKGGNVECVVLLLHDDENKERGMVIRLGQFCQGVVRSGEGFALERWRWTPETSWRREVRIGDLFLPCGPAMGERLELDSEVKYQEQIWKVVELSAT